MHICTRDRPAALELLIGDLAEVLQGGESTVVLYDDSTTDASRARCRALAERSGGDLRYVGEDERQALLAHATQVLPSATGCLAGSRPLGTPGWDLAGVRFSALLYAALDPDPHSRHLFLDDDIRLAACTHAGIRFDVDAATAGDALRSAVPSDGLVAAGASLVGRADLSTLEHVEILLEGVAAGDALPGELYPAVVTSSPRVHPESPGLSGGFLLTNRRSLRTVLLSRCYNEDWIWLRQLLLAGGALLPLDFEVVHAGSLRVELTEAALVHQFDGEVLDAALRLCAEARMPVACWERFADDALQLCAGRMEAVVRLAEKVSALAVGQREWERLAEDAGLLERVHSRLGERKGSDYRAVIRAHLRRSEEWRRAFSAVG